MLETCQVPLHSCSYQGCPDCLLSPSPWVENQLLLWPLYIVVPSFSYFFWPVDCFCKLMPTAQVCCVQEREEDDFGPQIFLFPIFSVLRELHFLLTRVLPQIAEVEWKENMLSIFIDGDHHCICENAHSESLLSYNLSTMFPRLFWHTRSKRFKHLKAKKITLHCPFVVVSVQFPLPLLPKHTCSEVHSTRYFYFLSPICSNPRAALRCSDNWQIHDTANSAACWIPLLAEWGAEGWALYSYMPRFYSLVGSSVLITACIISWKIL